MDILVPEETPPADILSSWNPSASFNKSVLNVIKSETDQAKRILCFNSNKYCSSFCCYEQHRMDAICRRKACSEVGTTVMNSNRLLERL